MSGKRIRNVLFFFVLVAGLSGCASLDRSREARFHGLILDADGNGVPAYTVMHGKKAVASSNEGGYFDMDAVYGGSLDFVLQKSGWETVGFAEEKPDLNRLYVFRVRSVDSVCREIEDNLDSCDYAKIGAVLDSLDAEMAQNPRIKYLNALSLVRQGKIEESLELLESGEFSGEAENATRELIQYAKKIREGNNG